jgi:hypothetical protein
MTTPPATLEPGCCYRIACKCRGTGYGAGYRTADEAKGAAVRKAAR